MRELEPKDDNGCDLYAGPRIKKSFSMDLDKSLPTNTDTSSI